MTPQVNSLLTGRPAVDDKLSGVPMITRLGRVLLIGAAALLLIRLILVFLLSPAYAPVAVAIAQIIGVRLEVDGSGNWPMLSRFDKETHYDALETNRAAQPAHRSVAPPAPDRRPESLWPGYRGVARDGRYTHGIRTAWPADGLPVVWRQPIGGGYASFAAADGRLFTIEQRRRQEVVTAYDVDTGRELWAHGWLALFQEIKGGEGPRATPTWADGRVFALGATGELRSLDAATGHLRWQRGILADVAASNLHYAMAASPLVVDGMVVVLPGGQSGRSVIAYSADTGDIVWTALSDVQGYTAPMLVELAGVRQIVVVTAARVAGLTVEEGTLLWAFPWTASSVPNIAQPVVVGDDRLFLSASYGMGAALIEVTLYRQPVVGRGALAHQQNEEQAQQLGAPRGAHLRVRRIDPGLSERRDRRARLERRPVWIWPVAAGRRAPRGGDRAGRSRPGPSHPGRPRGAGPIRGDQREDLERADPRWRPTVRAEYDGNGRL